MSNGYEEYKILNSIKPLYFQTKFPYNTLTPEKIQITKEKVQIIAKQFKNSKKITGGNNTQPITVYY